MVRRILCRIPSLQAIAPFQCSVEEAAQVVDETALLAQATHLSGRNEIDTAAVGELLSDSKA